MLPHETWSCRLVCASAELDPKKVRERQSAQLAAAFVLKAGRPLGLVKLMKLMYLAERESVKRFVFPIVFDDIHAMEAGMVLSLTLDLMEGKPGAPTTGEWEEFVAPPVRRRINVRRSVGWSSLDGLSPSDLQIVDDVWTTHGAKSRDELVHDVHHKLGEWTTPWHHPGRRRRSVLVPYNELLKEIRGDAGSDADDLAAAVKHFRTARNSMEFRPNTETLEAVEATRRGELTTIGTPTEAIAELNAED